VYVHGRYQICGLMLRIHFYIGPAYLLLVMKIPLIFV